MDKKAHKIPIPQKITICQGRWDTKHGVTSTQCYANTSKRGIYLTGNEGEDFTEEIKFYLCPENWVGFWGVEMRMRGYSGTWVTWQGEMDIRSHATSSGNTKGTRLAGSECRWGKKLDIACRWKFLSKSNIMCTALSEIITVFLEWIKKEDTKDRGNLDVLPEGGKRRSWNRAGVVGMKSREFVQTLQPNRWERCTQMKRKTQVGWAKQVD